MHTPGPWKIFDGYGSEFGKPIIVDSIPDVDGKCVANCICYMSTTNDDCRDNARLIAAAPEMLEALEKARRVLQLEFPASVYLANFAFIDEAIEKARGR